MFGGGEHGDDSSGSSNFSSSFVVVAEPLVARIAMVKIFSFFICQQHWSVFKDAHSGC